MKFKSALVTQASGSAGGLTASRNAGGMYFRARALPVNPNTAFQQAVRNFMGQLTSRWKATLTESQRAGWSFYAEATPIVDKLGDSRTIPPLSMYVRSNVGRLQAGLAVVDEPPSTFGLPSLSPLTFTPDAGADEVDVTFDDADVWANATGGGLAIFQSRPQSPTINYFNGPYRFAGVVLGDDTTPPTSPATIALPFPIVSGQKVFFQARAMEADGRVSTPFRGGATAA